MDFQILYNTLELVRKELSKAIPAQQLSIFLAVVLNPGITQTEISENLDMPQGTVSRNVSQLENGYGLVVTRPDTSIDTRRVAVWLTKKGEALRDKIASL